MITNMRYTRRVQSVRDVLVLHLRSGHYRPGDRFLSNRALAKRHAISYQTADRLLRDLVQEGLLERRSQSGTYVTGEPLCLDSVALVMHPSAVSPGSFGAKMRAILTEALEGVTDTPFLTLLDEEPEPPNGSIRVVWERPALAQRWAEQGYRVVLVNDTPPLGNALQHIDGVATDNVAGGALAANLLGRFVQDKTRLVILAGPHDDHRAMDRVAGFRSQLDASVVWADSWHSQEGLAVAREVMSAKPTGIFTCGDRLAEGLATYCTRTGLALPPIVGFDDAPIAQTIGLTTIAIPWREIAQGVRQIVTDRLRGSTSAAVRQSYVPLPKLRTLGLTQHAAAF